MNFAFVANPLQLWVGAEARRPVDDAGRVHEVPDAWVLVPPGDPALTRRVKAAGPAWVVRKKKGRRVMSQGVWAEARVVAEIRAQLEVERADPAHQKKLEAGRRRRRAQQAAYGEDFEAAVRSFLAFDRRHATLEAELALAIARHATPVGSGTVARTQRIPLERRAEAATIAWLRHHTTGYDDMVIPRQKGARREVRRVLAARSRELLSRYRRGAVIEGPCPLRRGLDRARGPIEDLL